ncbi:flagellar hook-basal body protein [Christensenellaceae bacterium OttesenSCG-928-K19]|nr:flagellar hook-basal body protein [Christensenellaceae bacterium OttesenSCG-928-K19]
MLRSFYIAGTGMMTQRSKMDVVINNISNADTVGYKQDQLITRSFPDLLLDRLNDTAIVNQTYVGPQNTGVHVDEIVIDFGTGTIEPTGIETDLAFEGHENQFFCVLTPDGVQYTRAGNFQVDSEGWLRTQEGYPVLGQGGQPLNVGTNGFVVRSADGAIIVNEQVIGQLQVVEFADVNALRKVGNNNYVPYGGAQPQVVQNTGILQGFMETSNVDIAKTVSDMMLTQRVYEASQRILQMTDESIGKTVNDIGSF